MTFVCQFELILTRSNVKKNSAFKIVLLPKLRRLKNNQLFCCHQLHYIVLFCIYMCVMLTNAYYFFTFFFFFLLISPLNDHSTDIVCQGLGGKGLSTS